MKPQVGRYYKAKNGAIFGPFDFNHGAAKETYPFRANNRTFTQDGCLVANSSTTNDIVEDVTHLFENKPHTFPTWEEFQQWWIKCDDQPMSIYDWFKARIQPLEIGKEYEFSIEQDTWFRDTFEGYETSRVSQVHHIRPIQKTKRERTIEALKAMEQHWDTPSDEIPLTEDNAKKAIKDAIKLLEEK